MLVNEWSDTQAQLQHMSSHGAGIQLAWPAKSAALCSHGQGQHQPTTIQAYKH